MNEEKPQYVIARRLDDMSQIDVYAKVLYIVPSGEPLTPAQAQLVYGAPRVGNGSRSPHCRFILGAGSMLFDDQRTYTIELTDQPPPPAKKPRKKSAKSLEASAAMLMEAVSGTPYWVPNTTAATRFASGMTYVDDAPDMTPF